MKDVTNQQVAIHLKRLNPWWHTNRVDEGTLKMRPRAYLEPVLKLLLEPGLRRAAVLLGPCRVGKTTLIRHLIDRLLDNKVDGQRIAYVEMDHPLLHGQSLEALVQQIEAATPEGEGLRYLFFDEVQSLADWERHLKSLVDHRSDLRLLVAGSVAPALKRQSTESGAGRITDFMLPPLTFSEFLDLRGDEAAIWEDGPNSYVLHDIERLNAQFVDYVNFGGYPELALGGNPERPGSSDIVGKVLLRDLPQLYGINDIQELNALFTLLAFNTAERISFEQLSRRSGVGKQTIVKYIEYLEAAFLIRRVFRVDQDGRRYRRQRTFKVHLTNPVMYACLFGPRHPEDKEFGQLVETALHAQRSHQGALLSHAQWGKQDCEVDLVESSPLQTPISALEITWSDSHVNKPEALKGLIRFAGKNQLPLAWRSTRSQFGKKVIGDTEIRQWPAAVLAFHYSVSATRGRVADIDAQVRDSTSNDAYS